MNSIKSKFLRVVSFASVLLFGAVAAQAADYTDVAAAVAGVEAIPATVSPVFLAFVTLAVGALTIRMVSRLAKKGASAA